MHRLRERARRITRIRKGVVAGAVATFALAWGLALGDQLAHGTKTSPGDGPDASRQGDDEESTAPATPQTPAYVYEDGVVVPVQPAPATSPAPTPSPAPLTTSQS